MNIWWIAYAFIIIILNMGFSTSKEQKALKQAKYIRDNLYNRIENCKRNYQNAILEINQDTKIRILHASALQISDMLDNKQVTTLEVMYTFIDQTINVGVRNNYVFDELFEQAIAEGFKCDQQRARDQYKKKSWRPGMDPNQTYPPFYGVPASIKQTLIMKGRQIHVGFVSKVNRIDDRDGLFMVMVRKMGFIPFVRSNVPQGCKTMETNNNMFGYCKNPWNKNRSCGGSTGGESGMVAAYCSPIGFGSDIGGSLRVPAAFTGLVTLKPANRYSRLGNCYYGKFSGGMPIKSELGPITRTTQDLILVNQYLYNPENYKDIPYEFCDPYVNYKPMNLEIVNTPQKYKIGYVTRLKHSKCSKTNQRAVLESVQLLKQKGHQLVQIDLEIIQKLYFFMVNLFTFDQKLHILSELKQSEPLVKQYKILELLGKIPWFIRKIIIWLISKKQPRLAKMLKQSRPMNAVQIIQRIFTIQKKICPKIFKIFASNGLDAVVLPPFVVPAPNHGDIGKLQHFYSFATAWNVLYYPAGVIPVTTVRADEIKFEDQFNDFYTKNIQKSLVGAEGMPVGVQIVSTPFNQQKVLNLMKQLESQIKFRSKHHIPE